MTNPFVIFWTLMVFASIAWYGFLLFYVGFKGGRELVSLTRELGARDQAEAQVETDTQRSVPE